MPVMFRLQLVLKEEEFKAMRKKKSKYIPKNFPTKKYRADLLACVIDGTIEEVRARVWRLHSGCFSAINDKKNRHYFENLIEKFPAYPNPILH